MTPQETLNAFYKALMTHYGPQHWWPGETPLEIMVGAVLTQNTNWKNVEKAIYNLKAARRLDADVIYRMPMEQLAEYIRPAGYFTVKAKRLKNLMHWLCTHYEGTPESLQPLSVNRLREELLQINGVGRETADSIILYALGKPTFVVDTYTYRILVRHGCLYPEADYDEIKDYFESHLPQDAKLFNEFHALLVQVGKNHCKPRPQCAHCPLETFPHQIDRRMDTE